MRKPPTARHVRRFIQYWVWNLIWCLSRFCVTSFQHFCTKKAPRIKSSFQLILEALKFKSGDSELEYLTYRPKIKSVTPSGMLILEDTKGTRQNSDLLLENTIFCQLFYDFDGWWRFARKISTHKTAGMIVVGVLQTVKVFWYSQTRIMQRSCQRELLY